MSKPPAECLFCRIARGDIPSHAIYEDDLVFAFLDIGPIRPGHTQVVPKAHYEYFDDLPMPIAGRIVETAQRLGKAMKAAYGVPRVAMVFTGADIAHVHAHLVPMHESTDITSRRYIAEEKLTFHAMPRVSAEELVSEARRLIAALRTY